MVRLSIGGRRPQSSAALPFSSARRPAPPIAAACALAAMALTAAPTRAQDSDGGAALQRVEVTGSRIKRVATETDSPVQVLRRDEIARTGATSVRELLDTLTIADSSALSDITGSNSFASGGTGVDLRGLGKQATLVLLNFRRLAPYGLADFSELFTNLDSLPLDAIDRIEVLKNGAAAIYGSDAVAGVINIITRSDYQGLEVSLNHEQSITSGSFPSTSASITGGFGKLDSDGYNVLLNLELYQRKSVLWSDVLGYVNPALAEGAAPFGYGTFSTYSYPGNYPAADGTLSPSANCPAGLVQGGLCRYDRYSRFQAVPESKRVSLFGSGTLKIGNDLTGFAEANYSHISTSYLGAFQTYGPAAAPITWGDPTTLGSKTFTYYGLPAGHPLNPSGINGAEFRYRFVDGPSQNDIDSDQYRVLAGLRGTASDWDWESAAGVMGSRTKTNERGNFSDSGFKSEIGDYTALGADGQPSDPNFFNHGYQLGGRNSQAVIDRLFPAYGYRGKYDQVFIDGKGSRTLTQLPAGPLDVAIGAEVRHERFKLTPTDNLLSGDIVGLGVSDAGASRTFGAVFGELRVPVLKDLELSPALRIDKYPDFSMHASPKLGVRWTPAKEVLLRGTVETGFRAPNLTESAPSTKFAFQPGINDPTRCPAAAALSQDLSNQAAALPDSDPNKATLLARADQVLTNECSGAVSNVVRNNPALKPETSLSYTLGIVFEPAQGVTGSVDYWNIRRKNEINTLSINQLLIDENNLPAGNTVTRQPDSAADPTFVTPAERAQYGVTTNALRTVTQQFINTAKTRTQGLDFSLQTERIRLPLGSLRLTGEATYVLHYSEWSETRGGYGDNLAGRYRHPRTQAYLTATWRTGPLDSTLRANYRSPQQLHSDFDDTVYTTQGCADNFGWNRQQCRIASYVTWDAAWSYTGIANLELGLGIKNLFNRTPPANLRTLVEDGGGIIPQELGDARGRMLRLGLTYKFL